MPESSPTLPVTQFRNQEFSLRNLVRLAGFTLFAFVVMGYHPGLEDDSFYLAAIKWDLNRSLYPHDSDFFRLQFQATIFDRLVAFSVRLTHLPVLWDVLLWQCLAIFLVLLGCWRIARRCFAQSEGHWAAVALVATLLTLPVPGIAINLADQYLHPRTLATAAILAAIVAVIDRKLWLAGLLLGIAFAIHAIMAGFGISFCAILAWTLHDSKLPRSLPVPRLAALLIPFAWLFEPTSDAWRQAAATRGFYFLTRWHWYEWLGVCAPLVLLVAVRRFVKKHPSQKGEPVLVPMVSALIYYGTFQTIVGVAIMLPPTLERLRPLEPMRYLHLLYLLFFLMVGGLLGSYLLGRQRWRWAMFLLPLSVGMLYAQRQMYSSSLHLELPFVTPANGWLCAFDWIRNSTPTDTLFAIDPHYQALPDEDYHGFRPLAERSVLADYEKDAGMAARVPALAPRWLKEVTALDGWRSFKSSDFERLRNDFAVTWFVLSPADAEFSSKQPSTIVCPYANEEVKVCRLRR